MGIRFTLGKKERLKSRKLIDTVFKEGKKFTVNPFRIHYIVAPAGEGDIKFGISVPSRFFKKAVERNRIKRLARESFRLQKNMLVEMVQAQKKSLSFFLVYNGNQMPEYKEVNSKLELILKRLVKLMNENIS